MDFNYGVQSQSGSHPWVRFLSSEHGDWESRGTSRPPRLCQLCMSRPITPECLAFTRRFLAKSVSVALCCHACGLKSLFIRESVGKALVATLRSPVIDPPHCWWASRDFGVSFRTYRSLWMAVHPVPDSIGGLVRSVTGFDNRHTRSQSNLLLSRYHSPKGNSTPDLFRADVSTYSGFREASSMAQKTDKTDERVGLLVERGDLTRFYTALSGSSFEPPNTPIMACLSGELNGNACDVFGVPPGRWGNAIKHNEVTVKTYTPDRPLPAVITFSAASFADFDGRSWPGELARLLPKWQQFLDGLSAATSAMCSTDGGDIRRRISAALDCLHVLVLSTDMKSADRTQAVRDFLDRFSPDSDAPESLLILARKLGARVADDQRRLDPVETFNRCIQFPDSVRPATLLTRLLDLMAVTDDEIGCHTPIVVRGYSTCRNAVTKGYLRAPDPDEEAEDFASADLYGWEMEGERIISSLSPAHNGQRTLRLSMAVSRNARLHLGSYLDTSFSESK